MKRVLIITGLIFLLVYSFHANKENQYWRHFWEVPSEEPAGLVMLQKLLNKKELIQPEASQDNNDYVPARKILARNAKQARSSNNVNIRYKLGKKPFGGPYGETQFDFTLR